MFANENHWKCMKEGSKEAFLCIYHENFHTLFCYGFSLTKDKELTKDCIQQMFLELWEMRALVNTDVQNVRSYLCTWLRRKISRVQSKEKKEQTFKKMFAEDVTAHQFSYEETLIAFQETEEKKQLLTKALNNLSKKQLEIIKLKFFQNLSYAEIAEKTTSTTRTLYNTLYLTLQQLREDVKLAKPI